MRDFVTGVFSRVNAADGVDLSYGLVGFRLSKAPREGLAWSRLVCPFFVTLLVSKRTPPQKLPAVPALGRWHAQILRKEILLFYLFFFF